jgi:nucleotide-binding universal stress UspA family protein
MKILVAIDGSTWGQRALEHVLTHRPGGEAVLDLTLIHVATPAPPRAANAVGREIVEAYYRQEHEHALADARARLAEAGVKAREIHEVGAPGRTIAEHAAQGGFDLVVMGSHGQGAMMSLVMGSTVTQVLAACKVPLLIVR